MSKKTYDLSFRTYFPGPGNSCTHRQTMALKEIPKWIEAYRFTHPNCESITVKIWFHEEDKQNADG